MHALASRLDDITIRLDRLAQLPTQVIGMEESMKRMNSNFESLLRKCDEIMKENATLR